MPNDKEIREAVDYFKNNYNLNLGLEKCVMAERLVNLAQAKLDGKLVEPMSEEEIFDSIRDITPELVEKHFPKGECKERGAAIVLHAEMLIAIAHALAGKLAKPQMEREELIKLLDEGFRKHICSSNKYSLEDLADAILKPKEKE